MTRSLSARIGYLFARSAFRQLRERHRSAPLQWRRFSRIERHRHQKPRRHRRGRFCRGYRARPWRRARRTVGQDHVRARPSPRVPRPRTSAEPPRDGSPLGYPRLRQLPAEPSPDQRRSRLQSRHVRRMDRAAHRYPRAPHRGAGRIDLADGDAGGALRARACACRRAINRSHRPGDLDARQYVSGQRSFGAGRAGHHPRRRLRSAGGVFRLRLRAGDGRCAFEIGRLLAGAGDRRGNVFAHPRLDRSLDLRAVRRRRGRRRARRAGSARHARRARHPHRASAFRRPPQVEALCRWRTVIDRHRRAICAWKAARCFAMRWR